MAKIVSIDIGTSRIKTALFDDDGSMTNLLSRRLNRAASPNTQEAEEWRSVTFALLRELTAALTETPDAVVLTGNMHALLGVDSRGRPVSPTLLWSDNSATEESDELNRRYGKELSETFGNVSIPVFTLPKIMRMKKVAPERYRETAFFLQSKDYIAYCLTGNFATDQSDASGTLAMELESKKWSDSLLDDLKIDKGKMPEILPSGAICGKITPEAAGATGLKAGIPVIIGSGDLASAALGSGVNGNTLSLTLGTAGQLLAVGEPGCGKRLAGKIFVFAHADPSKELYLGSVPSGGFSFEWFSRLHNISVDGFFELAEKSSLSRDLPLFIPYILGRGAPYMDYTPYGAWLNLNTSQTLADFCLAAVFGTLCPLRQCADLLEKESGKRKNIVLQALACREKAVTETAGALFAQRKIAPENSEASLLGGAVIAMTALEIYPDMDRAAKKMIKGRTVGLEHTQLAEELYRNFIECIDAVCRPVPGFT